MRAVSHAILESGAFRDGPLLEVGCGGCTFLHELAENNRGHTVIGIDNNPAALSTMATSRSVRLPLAQSDLHNLPFADNSLAGVIGLDTFALDESRRVLKTGGILLLRVSAYPWLRGAHDHAFGTGRRYSSKELHRTLRQEGFKIERITHANLLILLPAILLRLAFMAKLVSVEAGFSPARPLTAGLTTVLRFEAAILRSVSFPAGLSLYALAQKDIA